MSLYGDPDSGVHAGDPRALEAVEAMAQQSAKVWLDYPGGRKAAEKELERRASGTVTTELLPAQYWARVLEVFRKLNDA